MSNDAAPTSTASARGYTLIYHLTREAWHYPLAGIPGDHNVLMIGTEGPDGGGRWEFAIDDEPGGGLRVKVYDDAWQAFADIPEVFTALGERLGRGALLCEVVEVLDDLGFEDRTNRTPPAAMRDAIRAHLLTEAPETAATHTEPSPVAVDEACGPWGCDGSGWSHQGTSYASGTPEKQYAPCGRRCGKSEPTHPPA